jgi:hypothetical protein
MSMSSHVIFLRDKTDLQYQKFLEVLLACQKAGFEIDIDEIPSGVKTIRFFNSW